MSEALRLIVGIIMTIAGLIYIASAIRNKDWGLRWRGDYAPGGPKRNRARMISVALGGIYVISGLSSLLLFVVER